MSASVEVVFGAMCDSIADQIKAQGYQIKHSDAYQKDADAITRLAVRGLLPPAQARAARQRLLKDIAGEIA